MTVKAIVEQARELFESQRNPEAAESMARYMKGRFAYLGLPRTVYQPLARPLLISLRPHASEKLLLDTAAKLWKLPEREYQYLASDLLDRYGKVLTPASLPQLQKFLQQKQWWDSIDQLTGRVVGPLVLKHPELRPEMDRWSREPDFWLRRAAIIHQLGHGKQTDTRRLFDYCAHNARDPEFFIRKAIGWALRQHARQNVEAVKDFIQAHPELSPLSKREALKHHQTIPR